MAGINPHTPRRNNSQGRPAGRGSGGRPPVDRRQSDPQQAFDTLTSRIITDDSEIDSNINKIVNRINGTPSLSSQQRMNTFDNFTQSAFLLSQDEGIGEEKKEYFTKIYNKMCVKQEEAFDV